MIPVKVFYELVDKEVDVYTNRNTFNGKLSVKNAGSMLVIDEGRDRHGPIYIDTTNVVAIHEVISLPPPEEQDYKYEEGDADEKHSKQVHYQPRLERLKRALKMEENNEG